MPTKLSSVAYAQQYISFAHITDLRCQFSTQRFHDDMVCNAHYVIYYTVKVTILIITWSNERWWEKARVWGSRKKKKSFAYSHDTSDPHPGQKLQTKTRVTNKKYGKKIAIIIIKIYTYIYIYSQTYMQYTNNHISYCVVLCHWHQLNPTWNENRIIYVMCRC